MQMKKLGKGMTLKLLALSAVFLFLYPAVLILRVVLFNKDGGLSGFALNVLLLFSGFFAGYGLIWHESKYIKKFICKPFISLNFLIFKKAVSERYVRTISTYITIIIPLVICTALFNKYGIIRCAFEVLTGFLFYFIGLRGIFGDYYMILSKKKMLTGSFFIVAVLLLMNFLKDSIYLKSYMYLMAFTFLLLCMIIRNQDSLNYKIVSKSGNNIWSMPKDIERYNTVVTVVIFACTIILLNFRNIIVFIFNVCGIILKNIAWLVAKFMSLFSMSSGVTETKQDNMLKNELPPADSTANPWIEIIMIIIALSVLLYALYRVAPLVWKKIKFIVNYMVKVFKKFFTNTLVVSEIVTRDYDDVIERVRLTESEKKAGKQKINVWKARSRLGKITNPVEKIRHMYRIIICEMAEKKVDITDKDTTGEILRKSLRIEGMDNYFAELTKIYDKARYGNKTPDMDEILNSEYNYRKIFEIFKNWKKNNINK